MYQNFTERALRVMQLSSDEAKRFSRKHVSGEHILLGLIKEGSGVAGVVFDSLGICLKEVRQEVEKLVRIGPELDIRGLLPLSASGKKVIKYATEESLALDRDRICPEHILLGLLHDEDGVGAKALLYLGLKLEDIREGVLCLLRRNSENPATTEVTKSASECLRDEFVHLKEALDRPKMNDISAIRLAIQYINRMKRTFSP